MNIPISYNNLVIFQNNISQNKFFSFHHPNQKFSTFFIFITFASEPTITLPFS